MKKYLLAAAFIAAGGVSTAGAQTFTAPVGERRPETARRPPLIYEPVVTGAVPRAGRGNPLQMLNPGAPDRYFGPVEDTVTYDPDNPSRVTGIILFGLRW